MDFKKIVTFSFDDGVTQDVRFTGILNKYGLKCTFNLNSELLGKEGSLTVQGKKINHTKVAPELVKDIYKGHEVASHTLTHPNLTTLSPYEVIRQVEKDRENLSELVGYDVCGFAYPCGGINCNRAVADLIKTKTNVKYARTIIHSHNFDVPNDMFLFKPTASLTKDKKVFFKHCLDFVNATPDKLQLFYIWGHSYELDVDDSWDYFENICKMFSLNKDIYFCTNTEAFEYIKSFGENTSKKS